MYAASLCWWHQELGEKTVYMICVYDMCIWYVYMICVWYAHPICGFISSYRVDLFPIWGFGPASHEECGPSPSAVQNWTILSWFQPGLKTSNRWWNPQLLSEKCMDPSRWFDWLGQQGI
jgi:hypothetical protein